MKTKKSKLIEGCKIAKKMGYEYIYSIVKNYKGTEYYHILKIDEVLKAGRWKPAPFRRGVGWVGRWGTTKLPAKSVARQYVYFLANKRG